MWEVIGPLLPVRNLRKGGGMRKYGDRLVLDSIFYVLRSGCQWRMLPRDLMPWFDAEPLMVSIDETDQRGVRGSSSATKERQPRP
ncbi:transposase [Streptomyces sp. NPDC101165]|uniref:transposase n=1 Tax=Streptomyces sp. NPDC101165 TaxID=3366119 RepID=UPI003823DCB3